MTVKLPQLLTEQIYRQAEKEYPSECCGVILGPADTPGIFARVRSCANVQDREHAKDPVRFPRTSRNGYFMDPAGLLKLYKEAREKNEAFQAIYHSHIDSEAAFSAEDTAMAAPGREALYPDSVYLVISVKKGKVCDLKAFTWDGKSRSFKSRIINFF